MVSIPFNVVDDGQFSGRLKPSLVVQFMAELSHYMLLTVNSLMQNIFACLANKSLAFHFPATGA